MVQLNFDQLIAPNSVPSLLIWTWASQAVQFVLRAALATMAFCSTNSPFRRCGTLRLERVRVAIRGATLAAIGPAQQLN
jgi:hypothetical protein